MVSLSASESLCIVPLLDMSLDTNYLATSRSYPITQTMLSIVEGSKLSGLEPEQSREF